MSESNERNLNQEALDDRENAPAEAVQTEGGKPKAKKKRRSRGIAIPLAALMMVIALLFGAVVGYGYGRGVGAERLAQALDRIEELTAAIDQIEGSPVYDGFSEELTGENRRALDDLAGEAFSGAGDASILLDEDVLGAAPRTSSEPPVVVAEYKGGQLLREDVAREYAEQMAALVFAGYSEEEISEVLLDEVMHYMVSDRVLEAHAREMGLYELTDEDRARIEEEAQYNFEQEMTFYSDFVDTRGLTEEEARDAVKAYMQQSGVTLESIRAQLEESWWAHKIYLELTAEVTIGEAELQAAYDALLAEQQAGFADYPNDFEFAQMNGETILYIPEGYRAVRMLLLGFDNPEACEAVSVLSEDMAELNPESDAELIADYRAQLDSFYAPVDAEAQEVLARLASGVDFGVLITELGDDEGMQNAALRERGYYVSEKSLLWPDVMIDAAMALENPGDLSAPVRMADGVCILEYVGEVEAGAIALDDVREAFAEETLENARYAAYEEQLNQWLEEAGAVYYPERMQ